MVLFEHKHSKLANIFSFKLVWEANNAEFHANSKIVEMGSKDHENIIFLPTGFLNVFLTRFGIGIKFCVFNTPY